MYECVSKSPSNLDAKKNTILLQYMTNMGEEMLI